jgi:hypothetical protein
MQEEWYAFRQTLDRVASRIRALQLLFRMGLKNHLLKLDEIGLKLRFVSCLAHGLLESLSHEQ